MVDYLSCLHLENYFDWFSRFILRLSAKTWNRKKKNKNNEMQFFFTTNFKKLQYCTINNIQILLLAP